MYVFMCVLMIWFGMCIYKCMYVYIFMYIYTNLCVDLCMYGMVWYGVVVVWFVYV